MEMTREMTRQVIVAVLAGGVIIVALGLYTGDSIVTPLRMLTKAAAAFATGQQDTPLPPRRKDEIGELTAAFNIMMQRRCQAVAALRAARDDMERRVNERTAELAEANSKLKEEVAERRAAEEMAVEAEGWVRQFAEEIDRERERFVAILNTVPAVVFEDWPSNGGSSFVSQYVETMYGYSQQEWISTPDFWTKLVHPDDMERVMKEAARMLAGEEDVDFRAVRWVRKDGRVIWGETRFTLIRDPKDGSLGVRGFTLDITERKRSEEELAKLHKQLLETSRHAGMAEVATNVLHNVGNVLNSVNISAGLAAEQIQNSSVSHLMQVAGLLEKNVENIGEYMAADPVGQKLPGFLIQLAPQLELERTTVLGELEQLVKNVEHIKDIVAVQQSYASVAGVSQTIPVVELVEDSLRMNAGALMRHDVQLVRDYQATPVIQVDKHKVMQILVNLIRNAKYACDESGREDKHLTVQIASEDRLVRISIVDDGVGIPAENLTRIFSHGFTTRKTGHGFGLHSGALAAKELGGALLAHSDGPGLGAEFVLELPFESPQS
jgi:PAS domain S-box-containing protein